MNEEVSVGNVSSDVNRSKTEAGSCKVETESTPRLNHDDDQVFMQMSETFRHMIIHESNLMNHRLTWLMQLHGFLFAALAFAWGPNGQPAGQRLTPILSVLGITTSLSIMGALGLAHNACNVLTDKWEKAQERRNRAGEYDGPGVIGHQTKGKFTSLLLPWFLLPLLLALAWIAVLLEWITGLGNIQ